MKLFKSIEEIKSRGEFFKAGKIIPKRILRVKPTKLAHTVKFNADSWAIPTPNGYIVYSENKDHNDDSGWYHRDDLNKVLKQWSVKTKKKATVMCDGSPYTKGGGTSFHYNTKDSFDSDALRSFNSSFSMMHRKDESFQDRDKNTKIDNFNQKVAELKRNSIFPVSANLSTGINCGEFNSSRMQHVVDIVESISK